MSLPDTPVAVPTVCPGCSPELETRSYVPLYCGFHEPDRTGTDDALVASSGAYLAGATEAGGEDNARWCTLIHRRTA